MRATGVCVIHAIAMMGVLWAARGGEAPAAKPLVLHAAPRGGAGAGGGVHGQGEDPGMGAGEDGACHLRYVGPALVQGGERRVGELAPAMNRAVKAAPIGASSLSTLRAVAWKPTRTTRLASAQAAPKASQPARGHRRLVHQDPG